MLKEHGGYINNTDSIFKRKHGWTNLKKIESDRAIAFNIRTPPPPTPPLSRLRNHGILQG